MKILLLILITPLIFSLETTQTFCEDAEVFFIAPKNGLISSSGDVLVKFGSKNIQISPAGVEVNNSNECILYGHHHLIINDAYNVIANKGVPIPFEKNVLHFGGGQTEAALSLSPGKYELQLAIADYQHKPLKLENSSNEYVPILSEKIIIEIIEN